MYDFIHNQHAAGGRSVASMMWLILLLSGTEPNPGLIKFSYDECNKPDCYGRSIAYNNCNKWYNKSHIEMCRIVYACYVKNSKLERKLFNCAIKNISCSLFNHTVDDDHLLHVHVLLT